MAACDRGDTRALAMGAAASMLLHAVLFAWVPAWRDPHELEPPVVLSVDLRPAPPEILPPRPVETAADQPQPRQPLTPPRLRRERSARPEPAPARQIPSGDIVPAPTPPAIVGPAPRMEAIAPEAEKKSAAMDALPTAPPSAPPAPPARLTPPSFDAGYLRNPPPRYPAAARRNGEEGIVALRVVVTPEGAPAKVELDRSSGSAALDSAAITAVKAWRFKPARRGEEAVEATVIVPVVFRLDAGA